MPQEGNYTEQGLVAREAEETGRPTSAGRDWTARLFSTSLLSSSPPETWEPQKVPYHGQTSLPGVDGLTLSQGESEQNFRIPSPTCTLNLIDWISTLGGLHLDVKTQFRWPVRMLWTHRIPMRPSHLASSALETPSGHPAQPSSGYSSFSAVFPDFETLGCYVLYLA